jgi:PepB aminopeptidase
MTDSSVTQQPLIFLMTEPAEQDHWQQDNLVQIHDQDIYICLAADERYPLRKIQQAGRQIEAYKLANAQLSGANWHEAAQWAFAMGFTCVDKLTAVHFTGDANLGPRRY